MLYRQLTGAAVVADGVAEGVAEIATDGATEGSAVKSLGEPVHLTLSNAPMGSSALSQSFR